MTFVQIDDMNMICQCVFVEEAAKVHIFTFSFWHLEKTISAATRYHIVPGAYLEDGHYLVKYTNRLSKISWGLTQVQS